VICANYINGVCILDRAACRFVEVGRGCPTCNVSTLRTASFRQLSEIYCAVATCGEDRKTLARRTASRFATLLGRSFDDEAALNENDYDLVYRRLRDGDNPFMEQSGITSGCYDLSTIKAMFSVWSAMCGRGRGEVQQAIKSRLKSLGVTAPHTDDMPLIRVPRKEVRELTRGEETAIEDRIAILRNSKKECDCKLALWMEIGIETGARPGDVARATWGWFVQDDARGWIYRYEPHKTAHSRHENIAFGILSDRFVSLIKNYERVDDMPIFPCDAKRRNKCSGSGRHTGENQRLRRRANAEYRAIIGKDSHMAQYLARRLKSKRMLKRDGMLAESQELGHSPKVAMANYVNMSTLNATKV